MKDTYDEYDKNILVNSVKITFRKGYSTKINFPIWRGN